MFLVLTFVEIGFGQQVLLTWKEFRSKLGAANPTLYAGRLASTSRELWTLRHICVSIRVRDWSLMRLMFSMAAASCRWNVLINID